MEEEKKEKLVEELSGEFWDQGSGRESSAGSRRSDQGSAAGAGGQVGQAGEPRRGDREFHPRVRSVPAQQAIGREGREDGVREGERQKCHAVGG